jgi:hypothetical protein
MYRRYFRRYFRNGYRYNYRNNYYYNNKYNKTTKKSYKNPLYNKLSYGQLKDYFDYKYTVPLQLYIPKTSNMINFQFGQPNSDSDYSTALFNIFDLLTVDISNVNNTNSKWKELIILYEQFRIRAASMQFIPFTINNNVTETGDETYDLSTYWKPNIQFNLLTKKETDSLGLQMGNNLTDYGLAKLADYNLHGKITQFDRPCRIFRRFKFQKIQDQYDVYSNYYDCLEVANDQDKIGLFVCGYLSPVITTQILHKKIGQVMCTIYVRFRKKKF